MEQGNEHSQLLEPLDSLLLTSFVVTHKEEESQRFDDNPSLTQNPHHHVTLLRRQLNTLRESIASDALKGLSLSTEGVPYLCHVLALGCLEATVEDVIYDEAEGCSQTQGMLLKLVNQYFHIRTLPSEMTSEDGHTQESLLSNVKGKSSKKKGSMALQKIRDALEQRECLMSLHCMATLFETAKSEELSTEEATMLRQFGAQQAFRWKMQSKIGGRSSSLAFEDPSGQERLASQLLRVGMDELRSLRFLKSASKGTAGKYFVDDTNWHLSIFKTFESIVRSMESFDRVYRAVVVALEDSEEHVRFFTSPFCACGCGMNASSSLSRVNQE